MTGIWFQDEALPGDSKKWFFPVSSFKSIQVFHCRRFCEKRESYASLKNDYGSGFLEFTYGKQCLNDDATVLSDILVKKSQKLQPVIQVRARKTTTVNLLFYDMPLAIQSYQDSSIRELRSAVSRRLQILPDSVRFEDELGVLEDEELVFPHEAKQIKVAANGFSVVSVQLDSNTIHFPIPVARTVLDLISMIQHHDACQRNGQIRQLALSAPGKTLLLNEQLCQQLALEQVNCSFGQPLFGMIEFSYRFSVGPVRRISLPPSCSMSYVRYMIARQISVQFDLVTLLLDDRPIDLCRELREVVLTSKKIVTAQCPTIDLTYTIQNQLAQITNIPLPARVFDLKKRISQYKLAAGIPGSVHQIRLFSGTYKLPKRAYLGEFGLVRHSLITVLVLKVGICRLYYQDQQGSPVKSLCVSSVDNPRISDIAKLFSSSPAEIDFRYDGSPLPRSTLVNEIVWDPESPLEIIDRDLFLRIEFAQPGLKSRSHDLAINLNTTICQVKARLYYQFPDIGSMSLSYCGHSESSQNNKIIDINPNLDAPLHVVDVKLVESTSLFSFWEGLIPFSAMDLERLVSVKKRLSAFLHVPADLLEITPKSSCDCDNQTFHSEIPYNVLIKSSFQKHFSVTLNPSSSVLPLLNIKYCQTLELDLAQSGRCTDLMACLVEKQLIGEANILSINVGLERLLVSLPDDFVCRIVYEAPQNQVCVHCACLSDPPVRQSLSLSREETVRDAKLILSRLLAKHQFPSVFVLKFCDRELADSELFMSYGIPNKSCLDVFEQESFELRLVLPDGNIVLYRYSEADTVESLYALLSFERFQTAPSMDLMCDGKIPFGRLRDLKVNEIHIVRKVRQFVFAVDKRNIFCELFADATIAQARQELAQRLAVAPEFIRFHDSDKQSDSRVLLSTIKTTPIRFMVVRLFTFIAPQYNDAPFQDELSQNATVREVKVRLAQRLSVDSSSNILLVWSGRVMKDGVNFWRLPLRTDPIIVYISTPF
jgi:hypothetical protein